MSQQANPCDHIRLEANLTVVAEDFHHTGCEFERAVPNGATRMISRLSSQTGMMIEP
jgi:hypothetical protein